MIEICEGCKLGVDQAISEYINSTTTTACYNCFHKGNPCTPRQVTEWALSEMDRISKKMRKEKPIDPPDYVKRFVSGGLLW